MLLWRIIFFGSGFLWRCGLVQHAQGRERMMLVHMRADKAEQQAVVFFQPLAQQTLRLQVIAAGFFQRILDP